MKLTIIVVTIVIIAIIALVVSFVPIMQVPYTITVQYQDTETYYIDEPYDDTETYSEAVPLNYSATSYEELDSYQSHSQIIIGGYVFQDVVEEVPIMIACVDVTNTDDTAGSFSVSFSGVVPMGWGPPSNTILDLSPGETKTADCPSEEFGDWSYDVTPGTKEVEKERTVTKYSPVEHERIVTKERTETRYKKVSILEYLF